MFKPPRAFLLIMIGFLCCCAEVGYAAGPNLDLGSPPRDTSRMLEFSVSDYRDGAGKDWIRVSCDCEGLYSQGMEAVLSTLWAFRAWPTIFQGIDEVKLRSDDGTSAVMEQRTSLRFLGLSFASDLVFRDVLSRAGKTAAIKFETIQGDATTLSVKGSWDLEDRSMGSRRVTYVRYSSESYIARQYPAQEAIFREVGAAEVLALVRQLGEATARREAADDRPDGQLATRSPSD